MDMQLQNENWIRKEKQNLKNVEKQIIEQDYKLKELSTEIKTVKENETKSNKTLEKLSQDIKEYESNLHKINEQMYDYTDKTDSITQEIIKQSNVVSVLRVKLKKNKSSLTTKCEDLTAKYNLMNKLLQQRLVVFDK
ncbi:uncharacterized protein LOC131946150 [Physella acuta]|uniref:uncharacterized protein LOC131946150 n=1 Tax=Physella acuta TaxID=109671 RepID=UPI0027DC9BA4|nr:uncharacterized protein LOC131946150 [Physella acuta]